MDRCRFIRITRRTRPDIAVPASGFTIVELLVVLTIIAFLVGLLLPAIQSDRESARSARCKNNLKQLALALLEYESALGTFPYGGWGHAWVGMADQGRGKDQPGSWSFRLLPMIEQQALHELGDGVTGSLADAAYAERHRTPIADFNCTSRRALAAWPASSQYALNPLPHGGTEFVARSDYAINGGASNVLSFEGPTTLAEGLSFQYWSSDGRTVTDVDDFSGISHLRFAVSAKRVTDGLSRTYLVGEKHIWHLDAENGTSPGDNESLYHGYSLDGHRFTGALSSTASDPTLPPLSDRSKAPSEALPAFTRFGSSHVASLNMAFCDGSVQAIGFDVDPFVHMNLGHRYDGSADDLSAVDE
ncbi:MAG: DUF1559 domain-containing protein [Planctomycetota bacterium]